MLRSALLTKKPCVFELTRDEVFSQVSDFCTAVLKSWRPLGTFLADLNFSFSNRFLPVSTVVFFGLSPLFPVGFFLSRSSTIIS